MPTRGSLGALLLVAIALLAAAAHPPPSARPRLVVLVVVDQMRSSYLTEYGPQWSAGLRRLLQQGAWFTEAAYPYMNTVTCAGHATIATGTFPDRHGIISNEWWDRQSRRNVDCTQDAGAAATGSGHPVAGDHSARWLQQPTLAERMRTTLGPDVRVATFSLKARSAVMLAGRAEDVVVWFDTGKGVWVSSAAGSAQRGEVLRALLQRHPVTSDCGRSWQRLRPAEQYRYADDLPGERPRYGWSATFPHPLGNECEGQGGPFFERWTRSPYADHALVRLAIAAVDALELGQHDPPDFLGLSFSVLDLVGHSFGPRSHEVQDVLLHLDRSLGELLAHLDRTVGREHYVLALTADHGVSEVPEQNADGGRLSGLQAVQNVERVLDQRWGEADYVARIRYSDLYFHPGVFARLQQDRDAMAAVLAALRAVPGVARVFRSDELEALRTSDDRLARAAALSYFPGRSGDLMVLPQPGWIASADAATHGTSHDYDARVPLLLLGAGVRPGRYAQAASPADLAPTLAHLLGIGFPDRDGRILREALRP
ncbi:MAG: alkaline phosphatase family protein [Firmicutes bacterium]|nr:alkaline phosphatase family protein [Bacillota bacterium]